MRVFAKGVMGGVPLDAERRGKYERRSYFDFFQPGGNNTSKRFLRSNITNPSIIPQITVQVSIHIDLILVPVLLAGVNGRLRCGVE